MQTLDQILFWTVLLIPVALSVFVILFPSSLGRGHNGLRYALAIGLIAYAGFYWYQQTRLVRSYRTAIRETAERVATGTTFSVTARYSSLISSQASRITQLQNQLAARSK